MLTHDELVAKWLKDPAFKAEYERIEREEMPMLDAILSVRKQAKRAKAGMSGRLSLRKEVEEARNKSTADELEMLLVICIDVAAADGEVGQKEMTALKTIGQAVGLDPARYLA